MQEIEFRVAARDGTSLFVRHFYSGTADAAPRAVVVVAHGMAEHGGRYARLASALTEQGYAVVAHDHRGHGRTAPDAAQLGYFADEDGWEKVVCDLEAVIGAAKARYPGVPVFLLGHSMGSYIARSFALRRGDGLSGLILSGTTCDHPLAYQAPRIVVAAERARLGKRGLSPVIEALTFSAFNKLFEPTRTAFDWLSRDTAEVDRYVSDPLCGFGCSTQLWWDVLGGLAEICTSKNIVRMPKSLPIYIIAGERDAVNKGLSGIRKLRAAFEAAGLSALTVRVYEEARHELFHETNRDEVTRELAAWLDAQLS